MSLTYAVDQTGRTPRRKPRVLRWVELLPRLTEPAASAAASFVILGAVLLSGCTTPSAANIVLRKQVQEQQTEIDRLTRRHAADAASLNAATEPATRPVVSAADAAALFTTHGVRLGRLTGIDEQGYVVHVIPTDDDGNDIKAAGAIKVVATALKHPGWPSEEWSFSATQTRAMWNGTGLRYEYVVPCPTSSPANVELTVTFTDALTGRSFEAKTVLQSSTVQSHGG